MPTWLTGTKKLSAVLILGVLPAILAAAWILVNW